jgi:hypothetical protein
MVLFTTMVLASVDVRADTCVLQAPLKALRSQGAQWKSLSTGTELTVVQRKHDWTRVQNGETSHLVGTRQFDAACKPRTAVAPAASEAVATVSTPAAATPAAAAAPAAAAPAAAPAPAAATAPATTTTEAAAPQSAASPSVDAAAPPKLSLAATPTTSPVQLLILVVLVLGAAVGLLLFRRRTVSEQQLLDVVATRVIGRGKQLVVVDTGEARLLLAVTDQGINVLSSSPSHSQTKESFSRNGAHHQYTHQPEASGAASTLFKGVGNKVAGLWGRTPSGPPADWDNFDRILASAAPEQAPPHAAPDMPASQSRRSTERPSTTSSADLNELTRELQRHGTRRSA